ncbi:MAG: hypothetical protein JWO30_3172 [Fibrobacteres bacterium]|nr:hypothetical protein [Fibrobacterota bacterium]
MKAEIQQVLKMNKEGTLTDEQAAELLAELAGKGSDSEPGGAGTRDWNRSGIVEPILSKVNTTVKYALDAAFGWNSPGAQGYQGEAYGGQVSKNAIHMSRFDFPAGKDQVFTGNSIRMSSVRALRLERSEMTDNTIDMSKAENISVTDGKVVGCEIRASAAHDWNVEGATVRAVSIQGSKVVDFRCGTGSVLRSVRIQGAAVKNFNVMDGSKLVEIMINGSAISDFKTMRTAVSASEIQNSRIADLSLQGCEIRDLMVRMMSVRDTAFNACFFQDVVFSGSETWVWKKQGIKDVRLDNCRFEKVLFSNCRLANVTIKNVTLRDRQFRDLDLTGKTIDGDDEFLKAAGAV